MKYCFLTGDSFEEDNPIWCPTAGQLLSEHYGCKWETFAKSAQGNFYIFNSIVENIENKKYDMAAVCWSAIDRKDYITNFSNWQITPYTDALKINDSHFSPADAILYESLVLINAAQLLLEAKNIPYIMWWSINSIPSTYNQKNKEYVNKIKSKQTFFNFDSCHYEFAKLTGHLYDKVDIHPDQEGHRLWFEKLREFKIKGITK